MDKFRITIKNGIAHCTDEGERGPIIEYALIGVVVCLALILAIAASTSDGVLSGLLTHVTACLMGGECG